MSVVISNISRSFLQFGGSDCGTLYPVAADTDIKFQAIFNMADGTETENMIAGDAEVFVVDSDAVIASDANITTYKIGSGTAVAADIIWRTGDNQATVYFGSVFSDFAAIAVGRCFKLCIRITVGASKYYFTSNCFIRDNGPYTSTIEFSCSEDSYGFNYCDQYVPNKIRLPFYLSKPQYKTDRSIYFKSTGAAKVTKSVTHKEYEGHTDHVPDEVHEKLNIALNHEVVFVDSGQYVGEVRISEDYEIKWPEVNDELDAPADFKVFATPYEASLNNCADCAPWEAPSCTAVVNITSASIVGDVIYVQWNVSGGSPHHYMVAVNGGTPYQVSVGSTTIEDIEPGEYEISVTPYCEVGEDTLAGTGDTTSLTVPNPEEECVAVGFTDFTFDAAHVNTGYSKSVVLTGTPPFAIDNVTKPTWMNISIVGSNLLFSGTPFVGSEGNGIDVYVKLSNCTSDIVEITKEISVIGMFGVPIPDVRVHPYEEEAICIKPQTQVYLESGQYSFYPGLKVYADSALTTLMPLKWFLDTDNTLWRTNALGMLIVSASDYC